MNAVFAIAQCTCVLQCTSNRATTLFCSFKKESKNKAKRLTHTMFTKVHKYTRQFIGQFLVIFCLIKSIKVIKSYVFMYISEHTDDRGLFLLCILYVFLWSRPFWCTSKKAMYTKVHGIEVIYG
ncbi:MAG: hypothetical protein CVU42_13720 [Chloroflexi bacterium HGW-Chloroflexi-4]|jgi:hypothetical protein|nr:MAG: hypothetical protein CVU42_13720 [Chloroflexi bacterium HGW-Chloroflexi-4]